MSHPPHKDHETRISFGRQLGTMVRGPKMGESGPSLESPLTAWSLDLASAPDLEAGAVAMLSALIDLEAKILRGALFSTNLDNKEMSPLASKERTRGGSYAISRDVLKTALRSREQSVKQVEPARGGHWIAAIPLLLQGGSPLLLHVELDTRETSEASAILARVGQLVRLLSPRLETLSVIASMDRWVIAMVTTLISAVEAKDTYTSGHSQRVSKYSDAVAQEMGLTISERKALVFGALCHDVGKIGVSDDVLKKPGILSTEEFEEMKSHPRMGADIIRDAPNGTDIMGAVRNHHERWDGTGYPDGLSGDAIPLFARIVAVVDAFDAMTSGRSYSGYMTQQEAVEILAQKDDLFDPAVLKAFVQAFEKGLLTMRTGTQIMQRSA